MMTNPGINISVDLPYADREIVYVPRFGRMGVTVDCMVLGSTITGYGVVFDNGARATVAPSEIHRRSKQQSVPDVLPVNVVRMSDWVRAVRP